MTDKKKLTALDCRWIVGQASVNVEGLVRSVDEGRLIAEDAIEVLEAVALKVEEALDRVKAVAP